MANCKRNKRVRKVKEISYKKDEFIYDDWFQEMDTLNSQRLHKALKEDSRFLKQDKGDLIETLNN